MKSLSLTERSSLTKTIVESGAAHDHVRACELVTKFRELKAGGVLSWPSQFEGLTLLGTGGQGVVYRSEWQGADGFRKPVALKVFSPEIYFSPQDYEADMRRIAKVAARVAEVQQDHLLDIHNFVEHNGIRVMLMEWVDGYDLRRLMAKEMLDEVRSRIDLRNWMHLNDVVIDEGPMRSRLKPGIAIQILRECLMALAALHRAGVAHGDIKPDNIMLKRTGNVKLIDFGTAVDLRDPGVRIAWTPTYAAPEVLEGKLNSAQSDLASLGYVFVAMLSGRVIFDRAGSIEDLLKAKRELPARLDTLLPAYVLRDKELTNLCRMLIEPDPARRVASAEEANLEWAANVHRRLVKTGLDSDYENDIRVWMEALPPDAGERSEPLCARLVPNGADAAWLHDSTVVV